MYKDYFLFCIVYGTLSIFVLTFVGIIFSVITLLPYWILDNFFGAIFASLLGLYFVYLFFKVFLWKIPRLQWRKAGLKDKYYFLLPTSCLIIMLLLNLVAIPKYPQTNEAKAKAALNSLESMVKVCEALTSSGDQGLGVFVPELKGYKSTKKNLAGFYLGNNRKLSRTKVLCPTTGEMKFVSENESKYPTFSYNLDTGEKKCFTKSGWFTKKSKSCVNGKW